jgi:ankyrin repeat protein
VNKYIESRKDERYMRFEKKTGATEKFWEIYIPDRFNIWLCEGSIGSEGTNNHLSWRDWGSMDEGVNLQWASNLIDEKQQAGFVYAGEVKKIIDITYRKALVSKNPQDLLDCLRDGYSPFSVVTSENKVSSAMEFSIAAGNINSIETLFKAGVNIDGPPKWQGREFDRLTSPLVFALEEAKDIKTVKVILKLGADINRTSGSESKAPLHAARSVELIEILLEHGASVDTDDGFGRSALQRLLNYGSASYHEMVKVLVKYKADVNKRDIYSGDTPILSAAYNGNCEAVQFLLDNGADLSVCNNAGENALILTVAGWYNEEHTKIIQILLSAGLCVNSRKSGEVSALMVAADRASIHSDALAYINLLVAAGADIDAKDISGKTALMRAASMSGPTVNFLIKAGANIDLQDATGKTAAMFAAVPVPDEKWKSTALKSLIKAGANLAIEDGNGHGALQTYSAEAASLLLDAGVVPNAADGANLITRAIVQDNLTLALKILEKGEYLIKSDGFNINKKILSTFIKKIAAVDPLSLLSLSSSDADIRALLDRYLKDASTEVAPEYAQQDELPAILKPDAWPGVGKGKGLPNLPSFWNALIHPSPRLLASSKPLPPAAIDVIARMVLMSTHDAPIPAIAQVQAACDRQSLANFALSIFHEWADKGSKATDGLFQVLGYWGDGKAAKTLTPLIKHWPKVQLSQRAAMGLEILGTMGSDIALMQIQAIAAKTKYDSLRLRAEALLKKVAATRNLSAEQLEDRLVPSFDLSDDGTLRLDFGSRYFVVGVDEQLQPILKDAHGIAIKALPKASPADDGSLAAQSSEKWREFKKNIKPVAALQLSRLEQAMSNSRRWVGDDFINLLVNHPLLQKAVRGLVWAVYQKKKLVSTFAFRPDGTAVDVNGIAFVIKPDARVGVPHPLDMGADLAAWKEVFQQTKQAQPFPQLVRKVYLKESDLDGTLFGLEGLVVPSLAFKGLKAMGWDGDGDTFGGTFYSFDRSFPSGSASISVTPGLHLAAYDTLASEQTLSVDSAGLSPVDFSELIRELQTLKA